MDMNPHTTAAPRALALIRVSQERDGMVSPEIQRRSIEAYAVRRGYEVHGWVEGIDESGSRTHSAWWPTLERAVASVESGRYDVLVVWKFSRIARNRLKWATAVHRVETAGGRIESATEDVDPTTSVGRFTRGMLAELNAYMAEQIGEGWKEVQERRVANGRPHTGQPRWGYAYDRSQGLHVPDPATAPTLAAMYVRFAAGERIEVLVAWLNLHGFVTLRGRPWTTTALHRVLASGFASGQLMVGGVLRPGAHEPLISKEAWAGYLAVRSRRTLKTEHSVYLLSGLVRCARCKRSMTGGRSGHARIAKYRCGNGSSGGTAICRGGYVTASLVETAVLDWLLEQGIQPSGAAVALRRQIAEVLDFVEVETGRPRSSFTIRPLRFG